jgi:hypothetical protein
MMPLQLVYVRWVDNCYRDGEHSIDEMGEGVELNYYGLLIKETERTVTLAMEAPHDGRTRNAFDILKQNIVEMRTADASRMFRKKIPRKNERATRTPLTDHQE